MSKAYSLCYLLDETAVLEFQKGASFYIVKHVAEQVFNSYGHQPMVTVESFGVFKQDEIPDEAIMKAHFWGPKVQHPDPRTPFQSGGET